jgi:hypothetical protein
MSPRILFWDLENSPALGWFWGSTYQTNIIKVHQPSRVMSFAAKWRGGKKIEFYSDFHDGHDAMVARAYELLDEADAVVSYNGARHDTPHMNTEFIRTVGSLPSPYKEIDLYRVTRGKLKFQQNRLDYVTQELGIGHKVEHEGFPLWLKCMDGDEKAWARFRLYNIQDVRLTERYYDWLLPIIPGSMHPNMAVGLDGVCPRCEKEGTLRPRGMAPTTTATYPRFRCSSCGGWSQGKKALDRADVRSMA